MFTDDAVGRLYNEYHVLMNNGMIHRENRELRVLTNPNKHW